MESIPEETSTLMLGQTIASLCNQNSKTHHHHRHQPFSMIIKLQLEAFQFKIGFEETA
jgi:hypothetical protein